MIAGKEIVRIALGGSYARIRDVLYSPGMDDDILSTQMLHEDGIFNKHIETGYRFFRKDRKTLATGFDKDRTSYLNWVKSKDALLTGIVKDKPDIALLVRDKGPDWNVLHQRFGHPGMRRMRRIAK
jgi:hypothetical protein